MLKRAITYNHPFTDEKITEDFYFNISKAEAAKLAMVEGEGMDDRIRQMLAAQDGKAVLEVFERLVSLAYGKRNGNDFDKSEELSRKFIASEAYSELFIELIQDGGAMADFIKGMLPKDLEAFLKEVEEKQVGAATAIEATVPHPTAAESDEPAWKREKREPNHKEMIGMSQPELQEVFRLKAQGYFQKQD